MKKILLICLSLLILCSFTACTKESGETESQTTSQTETKTQTEKKFTVPESFEDVPFSLTTAGDDGTPVKLAVEILPNKWNNAVYDRMGYAQVFEQEFKEMDGTPQLVSDGAVLTMDFGSYIPKNITVTQDVSTFLLPDEVNHPAPVEVPVTDNSFTVTYDRDNVSYTVVYYSIIAEYEDGNELEFAAAMMVK